MWAISFLKGLDNAKRVILRFLSKRPGMNKLIQDMDGRELVSVFSSQNSNRMEVCKAGERLLQEWCPISESVLLCKSNEN